MTDVKPPRSAGDSRETVWALLQYQRESLVRKVSGITDEQATISPVPSGTTLLWLMNHIADAERVWLLRRFSSSATPDPPHETTLAGACERYRSTWIETDEVIRSAPDLDAMTSTFDDGPPVTLRWILMHLLEETARHAGHADILRELIDGATGR